MPLSGPQASVVNVFTSGSLSTPLYVTSSVQNPVYVSGSISSVSVENSVGPTGSAAPISATLIGGVDSLGNLVPVSSTDSGALHIFSVGDVSVIDNWGLRLTGTSTTASLSASQSFTGSWTDVTNYSTLFVVAKSDVPSAVPGLHVQWSNDAVNPVCEYHTNYAKVNEAQQFFVNNRGRYVRLVYINDGVAQGNFLLGSIARKAGGDTNLIEYDLNNSSYTPLLANAAFTGSATDLLGFASVAWSISSDRASDTDGVLAQFSPDGKNWTTRFTTDLRSERTGVDQATDLSVRPHDRYFRIIYKNGNQAQSWFRLVTHLNRFTTQGDSLGIDQAPKSGMDAVLVKSLITGRSSAGGGTYVDVKVDPAGKILTTVDPAAGSIWTVLGTASISNFPAGFNSNITASITLPVSMSTTPTTAIWVTGSTGGSANVNVTASVPLQVTASIPNLTASVSNFPAGFNSNITASITLPVTMSSSPTSAVWVTGSGISVDIKNSTVVLSAALASTVTTGAATPSQATMVGFRDKSTGFLQTGYLDGQYLQVTGAFHFDNTSINVSNLPATQSVSFLPTSALTASVKDLPAGFNANITASIPLQVSASIPAGVSITNLPATQSVIVRISESITLPVSMSTAPASALWVTGNFATTGPLTQSVKIDQSITIPMTMSTGPASAVWVTGTVNASVVASNPSVGGTSSLAPTSATFIGFKNDAGNLIPLSGTTDGRLWVTGNFGGSVTMPATQSVIARISESISLFVTSTMANPAWVAISGALTATFSGTLGITSTLAEPLYITGTVLAQNTSVAGTASAAPLSATLVGGVDNNQLLRPIPAPIVGASAANIASVLYVGGRDQSNGFAYPLPLTGVGSAVVVSQSTGPASSLWTTGTVSIGNVIQTHGVTFVSQSVTGAISVLNPVAVTFVSQSVTGTVSVGSIPVHGVTFTSQSVTGTVSVGNTISTTFVSQSVTGAVSVLNPVAVTFISQSVTGTVSIGSIPTHGVTFISQSVTGTVSVGNTISTTFISQSVTGAVSVLNSLTFVSQSVTGAVSVGNLVSVTMSTAPAGAVWVTGTIHYDNPSSGGGVQYGTGSVPITGTLALYVQESDNSSVAAKTDTNHVLMVNMVSGTINAPGATYAGGTGSLAPFTASLMGLKDDAGIMRPLSGSSDGVLYVAISGAIDAVFSGTQIVTQSTTPATALWITGTVAANSAPVSVTSTLANPLQVVGNVSFVSQSITGTVSIGSIPSHAVTFVSQSVTGAISVLNPVTVTFISQSVTGTVSIGSIPTHAVTFVSQSVTGAISVTNPLVFVSQSVTGAVSVLNPVAVTFVSQSITGTVTIGSIPSHAVTFVSQSVTGAISVTNALTFVSQSVTGAVSVGNTVSVAAPFTTPVYVIARPQPTNPPTVTVVTASNSSAQLFAANANRIGVTVLNLAASNAVFVNMNTSVAAYNSATVRIAGNGYWEMPFRYTGSIQIAASGAQTAIVIGQEFTA